MNTDLLLSLLNAHGVSGNEKPVTDLLLSYLSDRCAGCAKLGPRDALGNLFMTFEGQPGGGRMLVEAHVDEVGFQVAYIDGNGYIYLRRCGGMDLASAIGSFVEMDCKGKTVSGVIGRKPIHLLKPDEKSKLPEADGIWVDTGLAGDAVRGLVRVGDYVAPAANARRLGDNRIASKAIDNRMGAYILCLLAGRLADDCREGRPPLATATIAFTVQEELGCKGAAVAAFGRDYDAALCVDATFAADVPDVSPRLVGDVSLGAGPVAVRNADTNGELLDRIADVAERNAIPLQFSANYAASGGTSTRNLQLTGAGMRTATLAYPVRYMHTPVGIADLRDAQAAAKLLYLLLTDR